MGALPGSVAGGGPSSLVAVVVATAVGAVVGLVVEVVLIRPLYRRHIQQVLVTVGLSLAGVAAAQGIWGADPHPVDKPAWMSRDDRGRSAPGCPNDRFVYIVVAVVALRSDCSPCCASPASASSSGPASRTGRWSRRWASTCSAPSPSSSPSAEPRPDSAGMLYSQYAGSVSPAQGGVAADLRLHRRRHRRHGLARRAPRSPPSSSGSSSSSPTTTPRAASATCRSSCSSPLVLLLRPTSLKGATA